MPKKSLFSQKSRSSKKSGGFLTRRKKLSLPQLALIVGFVAAAGIAVVSYSSASSAAPVPCTNIGSGKYNCEFYQTTPVMNGANAQIGVLGAGTNWVVCQAAGKRLTSGAYTNVWWAYTLSDKTATYPSTWGWVSALYGKGGANDGAWGGGVPACGADKGLPPQDPPAAATPTPVAAKPPVNAPAPAPIPCSPIAGGKYNCNFYPLGSPVQAAGDGAGRASGYLRQGTNWIICQQSGTSLASGQYYNKWWGWTLSDPPESKYGWVSALYAKGGANDGQFAGVPNCNNAHGAVPSKLAPARTTAIAPSGGSSSSGSSSTAKPAAPSTAACTDGRWYTAGNGGGPTYYRCVGGSWREANCPAGQVAVASSSNIGPCRTNSTASSNTAKCNLTGGSTSCVYYGGSYVGNCQVYPKDAGCARQPTPPPKYVCTSQDYATGRNGCSGPTASFQPSGVAQVSRGLKAN